MTITIQQQKAARDFAKRWQGKGYEKGESQTFWLELLTEIFGIEHPSEFLHFEQQVKIDHTSFIDAYIPRTHTMIEQKSIEKDLGTPIKQSDGSVLNPFQQAKRYAAELPYSQRPRWIVTCNFREFWVYDMEQPNGEPQKILLKDLEKEYYRLQFLVDEGNEHLKREMEVSVKAGELVGIIYDKLLEQYIDKSSEATLKSLNILCVRLVFCLYAEDAGLFSSKTAFHDYLAHYDARDIRRALIDLFQVLDTPLADRDPYLDEILATFPYVNGGLFSDEKIIIPQFTEELKQLILQNASADFDWSEISPTIFGAVFESTLNPDTRRSGGMHYTSIENIHKVIDPLFLDDLWAEFENIIGQQRKQSEQRNYYQQRKLKESQSSQISLLIKISPQKKQQLQAFQDKLSSLTFFDPACGSGNFLTETFLSLRRLENEVIKAMYGDTRQLDFGGTIKVNISQFYGIEINDFACTVAKTALWIAESQTLQETSSIVGVNLNFLPLKTNAYIHEGNALRTDWAALFSSEGILSLTVKDGSPSLLTPSLTATGEAQKYRTTNYPDYIIGNPPFVGHQMTTEGQKQDILDIFGKDWQNVGRLDYVACWYKKALELMQLHPSTKAALVSTNSITQGEQVAAMWKGLFEQYNAEIDFAYRTFRWDSEADIKAHVHCVIIGFHYRDSIRIPKGCDVVVRDFYPSHQPQIDEAQECHTTTDEAQECFTTNPFLTKNTYVESYKSRLLPHWQQSGKYVFVTCHLGDSLPQNLLNQIREDREFWIKNHKEPLTDTDKAEYHRLFSQKIENYLDAGYGACILKDDYCANVVKETLEFYDGKKYHIIAYVIMPNHIHLLLQLIDIEHYPISDIIHGIKSFTTRKINEYLGTTGSIWHSEFYDRMIRNEQHYKNTINYIKKNAETAHTPYIVVPTDSYPSEVVVKESVVVRDSHPSHPVVNDSYPSPTVVKDSYPSPTVVKDSYPSPTRKGEARECFTTTKRIFLSDNHVIEAKNINAYLMDAPDIFIESRKKPLCDVPEIRKGNQPTDGGNLIIEAADYEDFIKREPAAIPYIKRLIGAEEYINNKMRYCLWLTDISPDKLRQMPLVMERVKKVREMRLNSTDASTRRKADTPWLFRETNNPEHYIFIPSTSSENRRYVPLGFLDDSVIPTNAALIIPSATLYHFGVLTSNVHMAWMRVVCGRLKSDYRYSKDIVYNNFVWPFSSEGIGSSEGFPSLTSTRNSSEGIPSLTSAQSVKHGSASLLTPSLTVKDGSPSLLQRISQTAQAILDARALYPDASLADLYDEVTMPAELRKAHQDNDRAVMAAYGFSAKMTESECVAELFKMYQQLTK